MIMAAPSKIDILKHELVPKHEILTAAEKKELLEKVNATEKQLPKILDSDPVIKKIEAKPGDVIKITRKSQTAGETVYYRIVAEKTKHH
ncbi:MAG: DNA-directed RNA polymerase subunit H [Candidatus Aenigmarchaeota archaeon]|nr:DNA-directed RNA polymerase subunit H [Candidatus Aenigmarchaeota archaeon]